MHRMSISQSYLNIYKHPSLKKDRALLIPLAVLVFLISITSCIVGQNFIQIGSVNLTTCILLFPWSFILVSVITESYGFRQSRHVIYSVAGCTYLMVAIIYLYTLIPTDDAFIGDPLLYKEFQKRLIFLMLVTATAYLVSEFCNAMILSYLKHLTSGRHMLLRVFFSISLATLIDTLLVFSFFSSRYTDIKLAVFETSMVLAIKITYEMLLLPVFWLMSNYIKKASGMPSGTILPAAAAHFSATAVLEKQEEKANAY